jgi:hypothetical protein
MTRMVIDICSAFNGESKNINIELLPPFIAHIVRTADRYLLTAENLHNPLWQGDFDQLRMTLGFFNKRWALAGMELRRLDESVEMAEMAMALQL